MIVKKVKIHHCIGPMISTVDRATREVLCGAKELWKRNETYDNEILNCAQYNTDKETFYPCSKCLNHPDFPLLLLKETEL